MDRLWRVCVLLLLLTLASVLGFAWLAKLPFSDAAIVNTPLIRDWLVVAVLIVTAFGRGIVLRAMAGIVLALVLMACFFQGAHLFYAGDYVLPISLANAAQLDLLLTAPRVAALAAAFIFLVMIEWFVIGRVAVVNARFRWGLAFVLLTSGIGLQVFVIKNSLRVSPAEIDLTAPGRQVLGSPLAELVDVAKKVFREHKKNQALTESELNTAARFGITIDQNAQFPLIKPNIYTSPPPLGVDGKSGSFRKYNVIVFLSEGLSSRVMQPYSQAYPGLTPNVDDFSRAAMTVDNYFNHTFSTYRGLHGQTCSFYVYFGGGSVVDSAHYSCIPDILRRHGYVSSFFYSQYDERTQIDEVMQRAGFDSIYDGKRLGDHYFFSETAKLDIGLSDQQFMKAFIGHLKSGETTQKQGGNDPFYFSLYNIETHALRHPAGDAKRYQRANSYVLDTIHNYDDTFGQFWRYFQSSPYFDNTIVIFTADHSRFYDRDFRVLVENQPDYRPIFVDRMPLLIYHPSRKLAKNLDANYASSIDMAPTLLHLLGVPNRPNAMLGQSLFEEDRKSTCSIAYGDDFLVCIGENAFSKQVKYFVNPVNDSDANQMYKIINAIQALELDGRVWDPGLDDQRDAK